MENKTLMTDFYELTMAQTYFNEGKKDELVYFDIFFRKNPFEGGYTMSGGLQETIDYIKNFKYGEKEIEYLRSLNLFNEELLNYLKDLKFTGDIYAVPDGTAVFPNEPVLTIKCDVSKEEEVEAMFNQIEETFGGIDILVNNASVCRDSLLLDKNIKEFKRVLDVNLVGTYLCSKYAAKMMLGAKKGKIINISSTNALDTYYPESCDYDASKAGVISLTHNMAREFAPFITVNCICPGWVKTQMNKDLSLDQINEEKKNILLGRFAEPEEIAKVVMFLSSSNASYINDSIIRVDGGKFNG